MCLKPGMLAQGLLHGEDEEECDGGQYWIQGAELQYSLSQVAMHPGKREASLSFSDSCQISC